MAKAKKQQVDIDRLCQAIARSRLSLRFFREERREAVRQYIGHHWSEESTREKVPVNFISLYCRIVSRALISKSPRVLLSTFDRSAGPVVSTMETWANREFEKMHLATTLERVVLDALFSVGICKVALAMPSDASAVGWNQPVGQPFAERVDLDDFVFDAHARDFMEAGFVGHRFRCPLEVIADSTLYSSGRKHLTPSDDNPYNQEGDERINVLGRGYYAVNTGAIEFEDYVDLWEIYVPRKRLIITLASDGGGMPDRTMDPLREVEWMGPDVGPYHFLGMNSVPGNAMPKGDVQDLMDLHMSLNRICRKLLAQAERQKEVLPVRGAASEDGDRTIRMSDGEAFLCDNADTLKAVTFGGPNQANFLLFQEFQKVFSMLAGNLDALGGLAPQSSTATQDKLLAQSSSGTITDKQDRVTVFTQSVVDALLWYHHRHPTNTMRAKYELPGLGGATITRRVTPQQRLNVRWDDLDIRVDPYSMQARSPQQRLMMLKDIMVSVVQPMAALLQQQGIMVDMHYVLDRFGKYMDDPDVQNMFSIQTPPSPSPGGQPGQSAGPAETTRNYVRESVAGSPQDRGMQNTNAMRQGAAGPMNPSMNGTR